MPKLRVIIKPPPEPQGDAEQQTEALRDYLLQMSEELAYVLTHLEADNINDSTFERIQSMIPRPYTGLPVMDGDASSGQSEQWARGDHRHGHDSTKADVTALEAEAAAREAHEDDTGNPHEVTAAQVGLGNVANERQYSEQNPPPIPTPGEVGAIPTTEKGSAGGVAELDSNGMVPSAQLPSYVDDVLNYPTLADFPAIGEDGKIYVAKDTNRQYRWSGSDYVEISKSLALGETSATAYRGDRGKTAYDHSQVTSGNPHNVTAAEVGLGNVANERQYSALNPPPLPTPADIGAAEAQDLTDHVGDTNNPHSVTAAQVGARPDTWMPTAADVGARADTWMPTAADVGARPDDWVPDAADVPYDNTQSGLMATDVQAAIDEIAQGGGGGGTAASAVSYDNTGSGIAATNVQDAIDEVVTDLDGKQDTLTFDNAPTANSNNPVKSGGVYTDVRTRVPNIGKGINLFDNAWFTVNQRGVSSGTAVNAEYFLSRWVIRRASYSISGHIVTVTATANEYGIYQPMKLGTLVTGEKYTISAAIDGEIKSLTFTMPSATGYVGYLGTSVRIYIQISASAVNVWFTLPNANTSFTISKSKLELGEESTLDGDIEPNYEEELIKCQTSTADPSDTYANKSLATEQQLAPVEWGTTVSNPNGYKAGQYFCWNGLLYRAKTAISSGGTITPGTNCEQVTEGGFNHLRNLIHPSSSTLTYSLIGVSLVRASSSQRKLVITVPYGYTSVSVSMQSTNILTREFGSSTSATFSVTSVTASLSGYCLSVALNGTGLESAMDVLALDNGLVISLS